MLKIPFYVWLASSLVEWLSGRQIGLLAVTLLALQMQPCLKYIYIYIYIYIYAGFEGLISLIGSTCTAQFLIQVDQ
jgi:hypothetical protein